MSYQFGLLGYCIHWEFLPKKKGFLPSKNPFLPMGSEEIPFFWEETQPWLWIMNKRYLQIIYLITELEKM